MSVAPSQLAATMLQRHRQRIRSEEEERERLIALLRRDVRKVATDLGVGRVWLIGSLAWGGFGIRSDIDLVLERAEDGALRAEFEARLSNELNRAIDLLPLSKLSSSFQARVLSEGLLVS